MDRTHAKVILDNIDVLEAFVNGQTIQYRYEGYEDWKDTDTPHFSPSIKYRVKPSVTISFRRYLWKDSKGKIEMGIWNQNIYGDQSSVEAHPNFIKWIEETQTDEFFL